MNKMHVVSGLACASVLLATGAGAEILGVQPGTSTNPKDNVPKEIQRSNDVSGENAFPGGSGPGTRSKELTGGMVKEKPEPVTLDALDKNAEQGGGAAMAAEDLKETSASRSKKAMKSKHRGTAGAREAQNDGPKEDPYMFQQQRSEQSVQGQPLVNEQPMKKQQPANRPASERGGSAY